MNNAMGRERRGTSSLEAAYSPFEDLNPLEYYGLVTEGVNFNHITDLCRQLEGLTLPPGVIIVTGGSDGKLEQHTQSKTELTVIEERLSLHGDKHLRDYFGGELYTEIFDADSDGTIDTKAFDSAAPFSYAHGNSKTIYPDRTMNAYPLHPLDDTSLDLYFRARERTIIEGPLRSASAVK